MVTKKTVYFRMKGVGSRPWHWIRKSKKKATPLRRMWKKEAVESECPDPVIIGEPLMAEPMLTLNPMDYVYESNLSDANAMHHRMAG